MTDTTTTVRVFAPADLPVFVNRDATGRVTVYVIDPARNKQFREVQVREKTER